MTTEPPEDVDVHLLVEVIYRTRFEPRVERTHRQQGPGVACAHWNNVMKQSRLLAEALLDDLADLGG